MRHRAARIGFSIAVSAVLLALALRGVDWPEAGAALATARYWTIIPMLAITVWTLYIRAQRWKRLLRPLGEARMPALVAATNIGFMANMVLPLRIGEVIRPVLASRREKMALGGVLATVVLERIFDMFTILLLFGIATASLPLSQSVRTWGYRLTGVVLLLAAGVALMRWQEARMSRVIRAVLRIAPAQIHSAGEQFLVGFIQALEVLDTLGTFLRIFAWSLYLWLVICFIYLVGLYAFSLSVPMPLGAVAITAIIAIAVSVPSAPGYIGAFQLGCVLSMALFGVNESRAIAYSIVVHVVQFVGVVGAGLYSLWMQGMSLREVEAVSESPDVAA